MSQSPTPAPARQTQMDGLRALALIYVLVHHFGGPFLNGLNLGPLGVRFFFVVSGFLITRILLKTRSQIDNGNANWRKELPRFQIRRLTRTLPIYWLCLLVGAALNIAPSREALGWTLPFLTNFYMAHVGYYPATISHFWTLAVQEQFYFIWPLLLFFLPKNWLKYTFAALIFSAIAFRYGCIVTETQDMVRWFNVLANLDSFATGGLLAWFSIKNPGLIVQKSTRIWSGALAFLSIAIALKIRTLPPSNPISVFIETFESIFMGWLVACSVTGFRGWLGRAFSWRPLVYLGQISYGVYVYHVLISILLLPIFQHFDLGGVDGRAIVIRFFVQSAVSIAVASLSWHFFEQPFAKYRERLTKKSPPITA